MIDVIDNISAYFDNDLINIIYKDLKMNGFSDEEIEKILKDKNRDLPMMEVNIFQLNRYKLGNIGFTSRELENLKIDFVEEKLLSNDYNGDKPTSYSPHQCAFSSRHRWEPSHTHLADAVDRKSVV